MLLVAALGAALVLLSVAFPRAPEREVLVYGFADEAPVQELVADIEGSGVSLRLVVNDLAERESGERFPRLLNLINVDAGIPLLPDSVERRAAPPYTHLHNQNRYYDDYLSSFTGVFRKGALVAVVIGGQWYGEGFWPDVLTAAEPVAGVRVFAPSGVHQVTDERIVSELSRTLRQPGAARGR